MLLDCVATFTCTELCTYKQFMFYTLLTSLIALDRTTLRKKVRRCFASVSATTFPSPLVVVTRGGALVICSFSPHGLLIYLYTCFF
jgi:hypothetical protein